MNDDQELSNAASRSALETGETWIAAEQNGDTAALGTLLADNFVGVGPAGYLLTKDQWIGRFKGGLHNDRITWEDVRVRAFGDIAILIGTQQTQATMKERDVSGMFRVTVIMTKSPADGNWIIAGVHLSNQAQPNA